MQKLAAPAAVAPARHRARRRTLAANPAVHSCPMTAGQKSAPAAGARRAPIAAGTAGNGRALAQSPARAGHRASARQPSPQRCCRPASHPQTRRVPTGAPAPAQVSRHPAWRSPRPAIPPRVGSGRPRQVCRSWVRPGQVRGTVQKGATQCLLWSIAPWSMLWPPGATVATGALTSTLLSTPLASLNTSVMGTLLSLGRAALRSSSMMW